MSVPDPNWFYSAIAQSAAAIVGGIGVFVAGWVMMMAGERSQIERRINEIDTEIKELERQNAPLLEYIAEIDRKDEEKDRKEDEESVNSFLRAKKPELDLEDLPTADEVIEELLEGNRIRIPDEKFVYGFKKEYKVLIEEIRVKKEEEMPSKYMPGLAGVWADIQLPVPITVPIQCADPHKYELYNKYQKIREKNDTEISYKKAKIEELQRQLNQIVLPEYFKGLIFYLIYFTIVVVILPLWLLPIAAEQHLFWKPIVLGLFIAGLFSAFLYIFIEIKHVTKKTKQCWDHRLKLLVGRLTGWFTTHITRQKRRHKR